MSIAKNTFLCERCESVIGNVWKYFRPNVPADKFAKFSPTFANKLRKNGEFAKYLRLYVAKISESLQNRIFCETLRNQDKTCKKKIAKMC